MTFKIGDKAIFLKNNSDGGSRFGAIGEVVTIVNNSLSNRDKVSIRLEKGRLGGPAGVYFAYINDLELFIEELPYDPTQQGDTEDDI